MSGARRAFLHVADHLPVGVLTNGFAEVQTEKLDRFPVLRDHAQAIIICEETGYMKPHAEVFAHAASVANTAPQHILYVGDSYHSDVQGSYHAGWHVAWLRNDATDADDTSEIVFNKWDMLLDWLT